MPSNVGSPQVSIGSSGLGGVVANIVELALYGVLVALGSIESLFARRVPSCFQLEIFRHLGGIRLPQRLFAFPHRPQGFPVSCALAFAAGCDGDHKEAGGLYVACRRDFNVRVGLNRETRRRQHALCRQSNRALDPINNRVRRRRQNGAECIDRIWRRNSQLPEQRARGFRDSRVNCGFGLVVASDQPLGDLGAFGKERGVIGSPGREPRA